jgi:hypothetical protein
MLACNLYIASPEGEVIKQFFHKLHIALFIEIAIVKYLKMQYS